MTALISPVIVRSHIAGLSLSNDATTPNTVVDIAPGQATDSTNAVLINNSSTLTVNFSATGANALDTGSINSSMWYHVFVIAQNSGAVAGLASLSITPTLPSGYNYFRRIGSVVNNGSSHIIPFVQVEENFFWATPTLDVNSSALAASPATFYTLNVPTGVKVRPLMRLSANNNTYISSPDEADIAPATTLATAPGFDSNNGLTGGIVTFAPYIYTNTSAQIRARCNGGGATIAIVTRGWIDSRGKFA